MNPSRIKNINYGAKTIFSRRKFDHVSDLLESSAENLAFYHTLCLTHKTLRFSEPEELAVGFLTVCEMRGVRGVSGRSTRQDGNLDVPRSRTEMWKRRFRCQVICAGLSPIPLLKAKAATTCDCECV